MFELEKMCRHSSGSQEIKKGTHGRGQHMRTQGRM